MAVLEEAVAAIGAELESAIEQPQIALTATLRAASLVRRVLDEAIVAPLSEPPPSPTASSPPLHKAPLRAPLGASRDRVA